MSKIICEDVDTSGLVELLRDAVGVKKILYTGDTEEEIHASVVEAKAIICNGVISSCYLHWLIP